MTLPRLRVSDAVVLAGAGISIPSGIASGQMFNDRIINAISPRDGYSSPFDPIRDFRPAHPRRPLIRFEQLIGILRDFIDPSLSILRYLECSWEPSALHGWLADALALGARVLTTNLDALIEIACARRSGRLPAQVADVDEWVEAMLAAPEQTVFKLHGTLRRRDAIEAARAQPHDALAVDTLAVTLDTIGRLEPTPSTFTGGFLLPEYITEVLRELLRGRDLVIIGYSGADDFDVMPSLRLLRGTYRRVIWIDHCDDARVVRRFGDFVFVRGATDEVLGDLFGTPVRPANDRAGEAAPRLEEFLGRWSRDIGLDDARRRLVCGEILRQTCFFWQARDVWREALDELAGDESESARLATRIGYAALAGFDVEQALAQFSRAKSTFERAEDNFGAAEAIVGNAAATYARSIIDDSSPDEALTALGNVMPGILQARDEIERRLRMLAYPDDERRQLVNDQTRLEAALMRGALAISRIARDHSLLLSNGLVRDVTSVNATVPELLQRFGQFPAIPQDKLLYLDYLAELSFAIFIPYPNDFTPRYHEFRSLCRLLRLPFRLAAYYLDLGAIISPADRHTAAMLYGKARRYFVIARHQPGMIVAARSEAEVLGRDPDDAEGRARIETFSVEWLTS